MKIIANCILISLFFTSTTLANEKQTTLKAIQRQYESVKTFRAHFVQKAYLKIMDQAQESEGEVSIKKPGKMKWMYNAPDRQILVSNNKNLWLYIPEENQVTKASVQEIYTTNTPALFLSGEGNLAKTFRTKNITLDGEIIKISLIPEKRGSGVKELILFANNKNYQIIGSRVYDRLGNMTEIQFSNIRINLQIPDRLFEFEIPDGVELLDTTSQKK